MNPFDLWEEALQACYDAIGELMWDFDDQRKLSGIGIGRMAGYLHQVRSMEQQQ